MSTDYITRLIAEAERGDLYATRNLSLLGWEAFHAPGEGPPEPEHVAWWALRNYPELSLVKVLEQLETCGY